jgi:hypothetical protein
VPFDEQGGFGLWSGTSFAAPVLAALVARELLAASEAGTLPLRPPGRGPALRRGLHAVAAARRELPTPRLR